MMPINWGMTYCKTRKWYWYLRQMYFFEFENYDTILRVEASENSASDVELRLNSKGFYCKELN